MRDFNFKAEYQKLLTPEVVAYLTQIHEYKGQQNLFIEAKTDALSNLLEVAKIQSTEASNRIEGIITTDDRLKKIVREKTMPQSRSEKEIAGYRDVLATIHESHDYIPPKPTVILQLHRDLYKFSGKSIGGSFKNSDNVIAEERPDGRKIVRFEPVSAWETPGAMAALCDAFQTAAQDAELDPLLLIPIFILDFLCIHPFNDGNGRMSRLLTLLLLYRSGYIVGKYISIEKLISDTKETYYEALQASSCNWHEGTNDYAPFVLYAGHSGGGVPGFREPDRASYHKGSIQARPGARDHKEPPRQDYQERNHGQMPGYQSDHRPAYAGRAAEIR